MKTKKGTFTLLLILLVSPRSLFANVYPRAGETAATFLKIGVGARALGMGGAFTSVADDASGFLWNPAGPADIDSAKMTASRNLWFESIVHDFVGGSFKHYEIGVFSAGIILLHMGDIARTLEDAQGLHLPGEHGKFAVIDRAFIAGYARRLNEQLSLGGNIKMISQKNADVVGAGFGVDIGAIYTPIDKLRLGASIKNIGPKIEINNNKFPLPLVFNLGASYIPFEDAILSIDAKKPTDSFWKLSIGGEWAWRDIVSMRAGYEYDFSGNTMSGLHLGGGLEWRKIKFDYAYLPFKIFGATHRFSLSYSF